MVSHVIATVTELRIYALYMTPNKNENIIFATH